MSLGKHLFADMYFCDKSICENSGDLIRVFPEVLKSMGLKVNAFAYHCDDLHDIYFLLIAPDTLITIHAFPGKDYVTLDIMIASGPVEPELLFEKFVNLLQPKVTSHEIILRGAHLSSVD
ncbi:MAG: S-adenosylmethionine decarboxylase [Bacillota bacterium]